MSVVLPTYRRPDLLERAIASVCVQTRGDWELLVVDDNGLGTPDQVETEQLMRRYAGEPRITYVSHDRNRGACAARNTGIRRSQAEFVAFLDDDDVWFPSKLERQLDRFEAVGPDVALVYGGVVMVDAAGRRTRFPADGAARERRNLLMRNGIGTTSVVMCRRAALLEVGGFDERLPSMQDFDLYVRLAQRHAFTWVDDDLLEYHRHESGNIGRDYDAAARANALFYDKHRPLFEDDPVVHHYRLRSYGLEVMRAGRMGDARRLLWRAWRVRPAALGTLLVAATLNRPLLTAYRRAHRLLRATGILGGS